jgi:hypothetical protein
MANMRHLFSGLSVSGLSLLLLIGRVVPGGYSFGGVHLQLRWSTVFGGSSLLSNRSAP